MALEYILDLSISLFKVVVLVDSKSVLQSLNHFSMNTRSDVLYEILYLLYCLSFKGTDIDFCWIPSHCGIKGNEMADRAARSGAKKSKSYSVLNIPHSVLDYYRLLEKTIWRKVHLNTEGKKLTRKVFSFAIAKEKLSNSTIHYFRLVLSLVFRLRTNSLKTKFSKNIHCICGKQITIHHILFYCENMKTFLPDHFTSNNFSKDDLQDILSDINLVADIAETLLHSPIANLL